MEEYEILGHSNKDTIESLTLDVKQEPDDHLIPSPTEHQQDTLLIPKNEMKSVKKEIPLIHDIKQEHVNTTHEEKKHLPLEDNKYSIDIKETITVCTEDNLYRSLCEDDIKAGTSSYRRNKTAENLPGSIHERNKSYECNECQKKLSRKSAVQLHINCVHKGIKKFKCNECDKKFYYPKDLQRHISSVHKGIKNYECNECGKKFFSKERLHSHISCVHERIRNYGCNECLKMFYYQTDLQRHISSAHKGIRNYGCNDCLKKFYYQTDLQRHISCVHKNVRNYECNKCQKKFYYQSGLQRHIRKVHKGIIV